MWQRILEEERDEDEQERKRELKAIEGKCAIPSVFTTTFRSCIESEKSEFVQIVESSSDNPSTDPELVQIVETWRDNRCTEHVTCAVLHTAALLVQSSTSWIVPIAAEYVKEFGATTTMDDGTPLGQMRAAYYRMNALRKRLRPGAADCAEVYETNLLHCIVLLCVQARNIEGISWSLPLLSRCLAFNRLDILLDAVLEACSLGYIDILSELRAERFVDESRGGFTPLMAAASGGHTSVIDWFLRHNGGSISSLSRSALSSRRPNLPPFMGSSQYVLHMATMEKHQVKTPLEISILYGYNDFRRYITPMLEPAAFRYERGNGPLGFAIRLSQFLCAEELLSRAAFSSLSSDWHTPDRFRRRGASAFLSCGHPSETETQEKKEENKHERDLSPYSPFPVEGFLRDPIFDANTCPIIFDFIWPPIYKPPSIPV